MIVSDKYIVIHMSKQGGTSIEEYLKRVDPAAIRVGGKHSWRSSSSSTLPTIGIVRRPIEWYISMYQQYKRVNHPIYEVIGGCFEEFTNTLLNMPKEVINELKRLDWGSTYPRRHSGLTKESFTEYDYNVGYYTWLWRASHLTHENTLYIVNLSKLQSQLPRTLESLGVSLDKNILIPKLNENQESGIEKYSKELYDKVVGRDIHMENIYRRSL